MCSQNSCELGNILARSQLINKKIMKGNSRRKITLRCPEVRLGLLRSRSGARWRRNQEIYDTSVNQALDAHIITYFRQIELVMAHRQA